MTFRCYACGGLCKGYMGYEIEVRDIEADEDEAAPLNYRHLLCGDCAESIMSLIEAGRPS